MNWKVRETKCNETKLLKTLEMFNLINVFHSVCHLLIEINGCALSDSKLNRYSKYGKKTETRCEFFDYALSKGIA